MSMFTARCIVVRCDVKDCDVIAEVLARDGALNTIPGWLEIYPFGTSSDLSRRKFICEKHAKLLDIGKFETPAEIPLSQALQDPRFQKPEALKMMAALNPSTLGDNLLQGSKVLDRVIDDAVTKRSLPEKAE
jgi:hypothetical protein